ncbi:MAG: adenylate/guanylate cyclase domain-containing protein [Dehalococcoidia bacterium]
MNEPRIQYAKTSDGIDVAFAAQGSGPPLLLLDGFISAGLDFRLVHDVPYRDSIAIASRQRTVVCFDWRGLGFSSPAQSFGLEAFLSDVEAIVQALGAEKVDIFANTTPAHIAIEFAVRNPARMRRLVLANPSSAGQSFRANPRFAAVQHLAETNWDLYVEIVSLLQWGWVDIDLARKVRERVLSHWTPESWTNLWQAVEALDAFGSAHLVQCPSLVILCEMEGRREEMWSPAARQLAARLPGGQLTTNISSSFRSPEVFRTALDFITAEDGEGRTGPGPSTDGSLRTILFTDLASSTALTQRLGDARAQELLRAHNAIVRDALSAHGGSEIKHTGDGIMASFPTASGALDCAVAIQRATGAQDDENLQVHVGLNAGEPVAEDEDLFGTAVQLARRVCDQAQAGEILVSNVVRELAAGKGFLFADHGASALKGFEDPVRLYEVRWRDEEQP